MSQERVSSMDEKKIRAGRQERYTEDQQSCSPEHKQDETGRQYQEDPVREQKTEDTLREMAEDVEIPQSITPEAVEAALEERKRKQRWSKFRKTGWKYLAAAACLCLAVGIPLGYQALNKDGAAYDSAPERNESMTASSAE